MSWTRIYNDQCSYAQKITENVTELSYVLDPMKYQHCTPCRVELGLTGGNNVSKVNGNLVDLESNLFGIDREGSKCSSMKFLPGEAHGKSLYKPACYKDIDTSKKHLQHCQMFGYPSVPTSPPMNISNCKRS